MAKVLGEPGHSMVSSYRNKNRGYQQLRVWQDAIEFSALNCHVSKAFQFELRTGSL
jgi:hypothetical protein